MKRSGLLKRVITIPVMAALAYGSTFLAGCESGKNTSADGKKGDKVRIAIVPKNATSPWFVWMEEGVKKYAADSGLDVFQKGPAATDATQQAQVIRDLIAQKVSAIGVVPADLGALELVLKEARDADIVVITHEGVSQKNTQYDIEAFNNETYGGFIMDNLADGMGQEGVYTTMVGHTTNASHNERADGGVKHQKEKYPKMKLLEAQPRVESGDTAEGAYQAVKEVLKAHPEVRGIFGTSSFDAPGVARAIEEMGLRGKVFTSGTGILQANKEILKNGTIHALTLWDPTDAGYAMAALTKKILDSEKISEGLDLGVKGYENMKFNKDNDKALKGKGWITITSDDADDFNF